LWTPEQKVVGFRNIARLYGGDVIRHGTTVMPLPRAAHELEVRYDVAGAPWNAAKFMEHNRRTLSLDVPGDTHPAVDVVKYMAALPRASPPGTVFLYDSGNAQILGVVVQRATHKTLAAYLEEKIWRPLGMEADAYWVRDKFGRSLGRSLLNATLRDYARFGYFFMHGARIAGAPILPDGWVADASRSHIRTDWDDIGYGYQWWIDPDGSYRAIGICGQMIFLDPKSDTVIVTNSAWPEADWDPGYDAVSAFNAATVKALAKRL
jgi:CubicO group peptidase (beta-lactamase class C family)